MIGENEIVFGWGCGLNQNSVGREVTRADGFCGKNLAKRISNQNSFTSCDNVGSRENNAVRGYERARSDASSLLVLDLDESAGDLWIQEPEGHSVGAKHGCKRAGEWIAELSCTFQGGFGLGEFSLVKKATAEDALDFGILGGDEKSMAGSFFCLCISSCEIECTGFEFASLGVVFIPPEGLRGSNQGAVITAGRPKFFFLRKGQKREKSGKEKK